jgi:ABC-2 type transport system permease protein
VDSVNHLRQDLAVAWRIALLRVRGQMQYRMSFWMQIAGNLVINSSEVLIFWAVFQHFESLGGWSLEEVILLFGLSMVMFSVGDTISDGVQNVPALIRDGNFDRVLVRPMSTYVQSMVNEVSMRHFGMLAQGITLLTIGIVAVDADWSVSKALYLVVVIAAGAAVFTALFTVEAILSFWTVNSIEAINAFTYGGSDLGQYPLNIFDRGLRYLFLFVVPVGFLTYYPALYLLDKDDPLGFPRIASFASPVAALLFCLAVSWGWSFAIRHYRSTGS